MLQTTWVAHDRTKRHCATIDCGSGRDSVFTGTMTLTSGLAMAATCMSRPHLILRDAGTLVHAVFFATVCCASFYSVPFFICICVLD